MSPPPEEPGAPARRHRRFRDEVVVRLAVAFLILLFTTLFPATDEVRRLVTVTVLAAALLNGPYYLAFRTGRALRLQAYVRTSADVLFITTGLYAAGGLGAAQYLTVYTLVPVFSALVFSGRACLLATGLAIASFLAVAGLQHAGILHPPRTPLPDAWIVAGFNLLVLAVVGVLAALLADAYRASRGRLASLYEEVRQAHDESLRLNGYIQRASRLYALGEVAAGVTHEMRNVLQGAFGYLDLARRRLTPLPPDAARYLDEAQACCENAMRIIRQTLDLARRPDQQREPVALADVAGRVAQLKAFDLRRDGIRLRLQVPAWLPPVMGSAFQLQQVLLNLIANAHDALRGRPGARDIVVTATAHADEIVLEVADTGPGIPGDALPRLFEPFFTTKSAGTGLGLAISAGIVHELGGRITARNGERGAVFQIVLPAGGAPAASAARAERRALPAAPLVPAG